MKTYKLHISSIIKEMNRVMMMMMMIIIIIVKSQIMAKDKVYNREG